MFKQEIERAEVQAYRTGLETGLIVGLTFALAACVLQTLVVVWLMS